MNLPSAEALYFGPTDARLFGWLHRPAPQASVGLALVVCNPFGFEEVCAHRSLMHLAEAAAVAGIPTLRFDYANCGNSAGDEDEGDMTDRWLSSVHAAIDAVKHASGAQRVCLLGVRLGALWATLAAAGREDVHGLLLIAPVVRGRAHLRELTVLGRTGRTGAATPEEDQRLESAGFSLTAATCEALTRVDLRALSLPPAPRVLIVERDDLTESSDWPATLERLGVEVSVVSWPGYAAMVDDPQRAATPLKIVAGVIDVLRAWQVRAPQSASRHQHWGVSSIQTAPSDHPGAHAWTEAPVHIDVGGSTLFAVMHCPAFGAAGAVRRVPAVLMLNSGSIHSIGPNRLWVRLARRWASHGVCVMRLDISGIGDSAARVGASDNVVYSPHAMADVAAALFYLRGQERVGACHVMGLCSGAYHAFKAGTAGMPVASALMINPLTYYWQQGMRMSDVKDYEVIELSGKYRNLLFKPRTWLRLLSGDLDMRWIATVVSRWISRVVLLRGRDLARWLRLPLKNDLAHELRNAARAGVELRFVFAVDAPGFTLLRQQSGHTLTELLGHGDVSIDFVPDADHTFTQLQARERLVRVLDRLVLGSCGVGSPA